jgi:hypothetical protein
VLRQWILEEAISRLEPQGDKGKEEDGRKFLERVLEMSVKPFDSWGEEEGGEQPEDEESRRLCGLGDKNTWGFQCSCSS